MKPVFDGTTFGSATVNGTTYESVEVFWDGEIRTEHIGHTVTREQLEGFLKEGIELVILGTGQSGCASLDEDAKALLEEKGIGLIALETPQAIQEFNKTDKKAVALIHVTC